MTKKFAFFLSIICLLCSFRISDKDILNKTASNLSSIETIEYKAINHFHNNGSGLDKVDTAFCFFDFSNNDSLIGAKYYFLHSKAIQVFNGSQAFISDYSEKRVLYTNQPTMSDVMSPSFMLNSIYVIRKILPLFLDNPETNIVRFGDTVINSKECHQFQLSIANKYIDFDNGVMLSDSKGLTVHYNILIYKDNLSPIQFTTIYPNNQGYNKTTFLDIKHTIKITNSNWTYKSSPKGFSEVSDSIWSYQNSPKDFLKMSMSDFFKSLRAKTSVMKGQPAPEWKLPNLRGDSVRLSELKGNLVLLEFWFPYCGGCISAIPEINQIEEKYSNKGLKVFGIEFQQPEVKGLTEYIEKHKIIYKILYNGKQVANLYGVNAAPTFFLIDKTGKIIYTSTGLKQEELNRIISENI